ncbi:MsnO8 family LLM class oxidoreductase [Paenibacillus sp. NPDC058174]|uniref:MsnO8 family LLM class oxidoreductase n=1 Tax=Paenibacillus sp. NPDC058174 TaxID=3346366 RepID=UPI0036DA3215
MPVKLSVLDRSPVMKGEDSVLGILNTVKLAQRADELGFHRFWVAEHHGSDILVGSSPEVLISHLTAQTRRIRIGSGGVMLQHYSPYKVAENFNLLSVLAPGRVDLGIGRGPGGLPLSTRALQAAVISESISFTEKVEQLDQYLRSQDDDGLRAEPVPSIPAALYMLGTGESSAKLAAEQGIPYVYAHFINGDAELLQNSLAVYRSKFNASKGRRPELILAVSVLFAESEEEAERQAEEHVNYKVIFESGKTLSIYSLELAQKLGEQAKEPFRINAVPASIIYGTKETVLIKIEAISQLHNVDEVMILPTAHALEQRMQTYEWLSAGIVHHVDGGVTK